MEYKIKYKEYTDKKAADNEFKGRRYSNYEE